MHKHSHTPRQLAGYVILIITAVCICIFPAYFFVQQIHRQMGWEESVLLWIAAVSGWMLFLSAAGWGLVRLGSKYSKRRNHNYPLEEAMNAIERITAGDFSVFLDVSQRYYYGELAEKINTMAGELRSMEQMRQDFVSNVSHEIRSPLTSIQGFAALLKKEALSQEEKLHYIRIIETESERLSRMSESLLHLSQLDAEVVELKKESVSVKHQLQDVILLMEPQWAEKEIEVSLYGKAKELTGDWDLLEQVWINLLHNAVKFTPEQGKVDIIVSDLEEGIVCQICDSGIGIPEESQPYVFERFYKADKARDRSAGGNGLGLSLVKKIVVLHGGSVSVSSKECEGSCFTVKIPY